MKRTNMIISSRWLSASLIAVVLLGLVSCSKSLDDNGVSNNIPVAALMAFNVTGDKTVSLALSGSHLTSQPLNYANYTGTYLRIYAGNRTLEARDGYGGSVLASLPFSFDSSRYYSAFVTGEKGVYRNVVVRDNLDSLSGANGQAYVRYINAIPDSLNGAVVSLTSNGTTISSQTAAYGSVSNFTAIAPGQVTVAVNKDGVNKTRTLDLEQRKVYTVLLTKNVSSGSPADSLNIRYITNGTLEAKDNVNGQQTNGSSAEQSTSLQ
jgi:hypothetical protein